jgi:hypothetical protein
VVHSECGWGSGSGGGWAREEENRRAILIYGETKPAIWPTWRLKGASRASASSVCAGPMSQDSSGVND